MTSPLVSTLVACARMRGVRRYLPAYTREVLSLATTQALYRWEVLIVLLLVGLPSLFLGLR